MGTVKIVHPLDGSDDFNHGVVSVQWDVGEEGDVKQYRMGYDGAFDVLVDRRPYVGDALAWCFSSWNPASDIRSELTRQSGCAVMFPEVAEDGSKSVKRVACSPDVAGVAALGFVVDFDQRSLSFFSVIWRRSDAGAPLLDARRLSLLRICTHCKCKPLVWVVGSLRAVLMHCRSALMYVYI